MFRSWYATCPRGAESVLKRELADRGAKGIRLGQGGVRFTGERETALRGCLDLRTALRVLEPIGEFPAAGAEQLYEGAAKLPWQELIAPGQTFAVTARGRAPELPHTHFVELKVKDATVDALRARTGARSDVDPRNPDLLAVAHLARGACSLSLDLAGDLLSNRGYRVRAVEAPLRESLAAAVVLLSDGKGARRCAIPCAGRGPWPSRRPCSRRRGRRASAARSPARDGRAPPGRTRPPCAGSAPNCASARPAGRPRACRRRSLPTATPKHPARGADRPGSARARFCSSPA